MTSGNRLRPLGSARVVLVSLVGLAALSFVPAWLIATSAATKGESIDWDVFGVIATAAGTLLLAVATVLLARSTNEAVRLQLEEQRLHRSPLVIHSWSQIRQATPEQARSEGRESALAISFRLVNAGEGPATEVQGRLHYDDPANGLRALTASVHASVILPGGVQQFISIIGSELSLEPSQLMAATERIRVIGTFSDPRRSEHGTIRPNVPSGEATLARSVEDEPAEERPDTTSVVPGNPGTMSGGTIVPNVRFTVQNGGPEPARNVTAGIEFEGIPHPADTPSRDVLAQGEVFEAALNIPGELLSGRTPEDLNPLLSTWARYADGQGRRWLTIRRPGGTPETTRET